MKKDFVCFNSWKKYFYIKFRGWITNLFHIDTRFSFYRELFHNNRLTFGQNKFNLFKKNIEWTDRHRSIVTTMNTITPTKYEYFNVRNFRVQKISRISRMTPQFAKLNGREKNLLADSRKLLPRRHGFQIFLVIFCLLEHKNRLFSLFYSCFCLGKSNFAKIYSCKMN